MLNGVILCCYYNYSMPRKKVIIIKALIFTFYGLIGVIIHDLVVLTLFSGLISFT